MILLLIFLIITYKNILLSLECRPLFFFTRLSKSFKYEKTMYTSVENLTLPEGVFSVSVANFDQNDKNKLISIYSLWRDLSNNLTALGGRGVNLPEGLSEGVFCLAMNTVRVNGAIPGANSSFDCYSLPNKRRIQVKACSVLPDLTSFGPNSEWDDIYFMDFYVNGLWDGSFNIYHIDTPLIYNHKVNVKQTVKDQQREGRRPRFSIYKELINALDIKPVLKGNIHTL